MSTEFRMTLPPVTLATASARQREPLEAAQKRMGMIPNMYTSMAVAPGLLETYLSGYDRFRKDSGFTSAEQEVVLLTISAENGCEYCVAAHSTLADGPSKLAREVTDAIRGGAAIADARLSALSALTRAMVATRGRPPATDVQAFLDAGYAEEQVLEILLAVAVKTISNYANHLFQTPVDAPFQARAWTAPRRSAA